MNKLSTLAYMVCLATCFPSVAVPARGSLAPNIEFIDQNGDHLVLSNFIGRKIALVFLPRTSSVGFDSKAEARNLTECRKHLRDHDIELICMSASSLEKLSKFIEKNQLAFPLFHVEKEALKTYDVKGLMGNYRYTFLIDEEGVVVQVITKVDVNHHAQQIIDGFYAVQ